MDDEEIKRLVTAGYEHLLKPQGREIEHRVTAGLGYLQAGGGEELRSHYLWLLDRMLGNIRPEDLSTPTVVSLVALLMPDHSRIVGGGLPDPRSERPRNGVVLRLIPRSATTN